MALFTDGIISSAEDLAAHDSSVMTVAATEGIDLSQKAALAQEELGVELLAVLPRVEGYDAQFSSGRMEQLGGVVVTPPLRLWHAFRTLELVYRDAYNSQLNDRYKGRWEEYRKLAKWAAGRLLETGVGIVVEPVPQAGQPLLSTGAGPGAGAEATYYTRVAWVNRRGEEGAAGEWGLLVVPAGSSLVVQPGAPPEKATGWNVYVGTAPDALTRQNAEPLAVGDAWRLEGAPAGDGPRPGDGQRASFMRALPRVLQRG
jgi:hypothetical protein